ncbi:MULTISPECIES: response regulator transcription factor [Sphingomonadaceae]|jgi:two-component system OmpR family response regulator|uniref:response regulator transcription factor n=1 Tax=Sphingomonadales TaxID=204457 RepID=UPI000A37A6E1|nr:MULTISPECIES: response regulator transcription factor [Sphingomonadaceae]OUC52918.1 DNA-binding response regulator [Sphingobium sp. GW456-12-10-14-TSB1]QCI92945.1 response regulator transcription factor [Novosphingobium sp. EMRT-2]
MHILLAEDDIDTAVFVQRGLIQLGHVVTQVTNGEDALRLAAKDGFEAIVLDRMMPGMEGLDVLRQLRAASISVPVIVLTAKGGISDRVSGLDAGADDYLVKPFAMAELVARLNAVTRRSPMPEVSTRLEVGDVVLDAMRRSVTRAGRVIHLQPREFALLEVLMRNAGRVVTRTMFLEQVWGFHFDPQTNIVESHLSRMRAKLRADFPDDPIETIRGTGYRMRSND